MDEKSWHILQILSEERNITKAAERLYISQPALTYRIQSIEEEFEVKLLYRSKKGIKFTPEGEHLLHYAREMLYQKQKIKEQLANLASEVQGTLKLGVASNFAYYKLPKLLKEFLKQHPKIQINLYTGISHNILQLLNDDQLHIGIIRGEYEWTDQKHLIDQESLCIISKEPFIFSHLPNMPKIEYVTDPFLKKIIDQWWKEHFSTPPMVTMVVDNVEISKEMVKSGLGYAIVPDACLKVEDQLYHFPMSWSDGKTVIRNTWLVFQGSESNQLKTIRAFVDFLLRTKF